jgi:hypothetical protein
MTLFTYSKFHNAALYQAIWFTAVLGTTEFEWLLVLLLVLHLFASNDWRTELPLMLCGAAVGVSMDTVFTMVGMFEFAPSSPSATSSPSVPFWLVALWMGFCATLRSSMSFMTARPILMMCLAAIGAPSSYLAAMKLGAVTFPHGTLLTAIVVGAGWVIVTPVLIFLQRLLSEKPQGQLAS